MYLGNIFIHTIYKIATKIFWIYLFLFISITAEHKVSFFTFCLPLCVCLSTASLLVCLFGSMFFFLVFLPKFLPVFMPLTLLVCLAATLLLSLYLLY